MSVEMSGTRSDRVLPWLRVGHAIDDPKVTAEEAAELGGLNFDVELRRASFANAGGDGWLVVGDRFALVRKDTNQFFSYVSRDYKPVQYAEAFDFMNRFVETETARFVAAGALSGGRQGFVVVQLTGDETLDPEPLGVEDEHELYVVLRTSHDLSKAVEVAVLPMRLRCVNQLVLPSLVANAPQRWSIKHVGDPGRKLRQAEDTVGRTLRYATVFGNTVRQLASVRVTADDLRYVLGMVLPNRPGRPKQIDAITTAFRSAPEVGFTNTGWGAVNAVSEYFEHGRQGGSRTAQARFVDGFAGATAKFVGRTAQLMLARA